MKLYVITANTYDSGWGAEITLFGIYSDRAKAETRQREVLNKYGQADMEYIDLNVDCEKYLGGYIE